MRILAMTLLLWIVSGAGAHPVPRDNHDRTIVIHLTPEALLIDYRLEVDEFRALRDLEGVELGPVRERSQVHQAYLRHLAPVIGNNLVVRLDGRELPLNCVSQSYRLLDHVRCDYRFRAAWQLSDRPHTVSLFEGNFHDDTVSSLRLTLADNPEFTLTHLVVPDDELLARNPEALRPGDRDRLRRLSFTVRAEPAFLAGLVRPALVPDPDPVRPAARGRARALASESKPVPPDPVGFVRHLPPESETPDTDDHLLRLLFDTRRGLLVLLLLAAGFGAVHALTPGHGKTMVAAYLVGERGTVWHAIVLGIVTTLTHTSAVLILAAMLPLLFPEAVPATIQGVLGLVGGLLIAGLGMWLLLARLSGRADHIHLGGGHHHGTETEPERPTWWGLVVLGISGGIVPCWDAIAMLALAISTQRLWLGLPLLLAFSAGLAGVLVALGIAVVRARDLAGDRLESEGWRRFVRLLPILSALVISLLGLWLCYASARLIA